MDTRTGLPYKAELPLEEDIREAQKIIDDQAQKPEINATGTQNIEKLRLASCERALLPSSYRLQGVTLSDRVFHSFEGFVVTRDGRYNEGQVCVKAFREPKPENLFEVKRSFYLKMIKWKNAEHPNVLPCLGVSEQFWVVSPWLDNGNINQYLKKKPDENRCKLLAQAACGLEYLHSRDIIHGDVNPGNILIDDGGTACLGDFGIMGFIIRINLLEPVTNIPNPDVVRYMAPELLEPAPNAAVYATYLSDIYSFTMTICEVLAKITPYGEDPSNLIIGKVLRGERPPFPNNVWPPNMGKIIKDSLDNVPEKRRRLRDMREVLLQVADQDPPLDLPPPTD